MGLEGAWTALVTPFDAEMQLDAEGLLKDVEFQIAQGIDGVLPVGTTGESPTLTWEEHNQVVDSVLRKCKGRCGVLAGTGSNSTQEALVSTRHAVDSGADAVLMVDCYYNGPSSQELRDEYYGAVAAAFPETTVVPYVIPGRSGTALEVEDLAILAGRYPNVNTVKEATGNLERMARTRALLGGEFSIMSGDDDVTYRMMTDDSIKANGVISVASNVIPGAVSRMVKLAAAGDREAAAQVRDDIAPLLGIVTVKVDNPRTLPSGEQVVVKDRYRNPLAVKTLMTGLGMAAGTCRQPLGKMTRAGVEVVRNAVREVWDRNADVLRPINEFYGVDVEARMSDDAIWDGLSL